MIFLYIYDLGLLCLQKCQSAIDLNLAFPLQLHSYIVFASSKVSGADSSEPSLLGDVISNWNYFPQSAMERNQKSYLSEPPFFIFLLFPMFR